MLLSMGIGTHLRDNQCSWDNDIGIVAWLVTIASKLSDGERLEIFTNETPDVSWMSLLYVGWGKFHVSHQLSDAI